MQIYSSESVRDVAATYETNSAIQIDMLVAAKTKQASKADADIAGVGPEVGKEIPAKEDILNTN